MKRISFLLISIVYFLWVLFQNKALYTEQFNPNRFKREFEQSQWRVPQSKHPISDETLYAYAGYEYIRGINPILINPEAPPIGKYLIGLSIILFHNQRVFSLLFATVSLLLVYLTIKMISRSSLASSLGVFLTATNTLFVDQIIHAPQLEIFQLFFLLLFIFCYLKYSQNDKVIYLVLAGIIFGLFLSVKVFFLHFILVNGWIVLSYVFRKIEFKRLIKELFILNILSLVTFTFTYFSYFLSGGTLRSFLGVQKWIFLFYRQSTIDMTKLFGNYISLIVLNRWRVWSTGYPYVPYNSWSILWPIIFVFGNASTFLLMKIKRYREQTAFIISFLIVYNIFLFTVPVFPRYLLLLFIPYIILISIYIQILFKKS